MVRPWPPGLASSTRIGSLGGSGGFFEDHHNVLRWCGSLVDYPDLAVIETGHFDLTNGYDDDWGKSVSGPGRRRTRPVRPGRTLGHRRASTSTAAPTTAIPAACIAATWAAAFDRPLRPGHRRRFRHPLLPPYRRHGFPVRSTRPRSHSSPATTGPGTTSASGRGSISPEKAYLDLAGDIRHICDRASGYDPPRYRPGTPGHFGFLEQLRSARPGPSSA